MQMLSSNQGRPEGGGGSANGTIAKGPMTLNDPHLLQNSTQLKHYKLLTLHSVMFFFILHISFSLYNTF